MAPIAEDQLLTIADAARLLGISRTTAYHWASTGRLPVVRYGTRGARVPRRALDAYIDRLTDEALAAVDQERP